MKKRVSWLLIMIILITSIPFGNITFAEVTYAEDLFISEYVEGGSYNKAIEIYNGTGDTVDLSLYTLRRNDKGTGDFIAMQIPLSGDLDHGQVIVIVASQADPEVRGKGTIVLGDAEYNGDDPVALFKGDDEIDRIGINGDVDFGKDKTFVRNISVKAGLTGEQDPRSNGEWTMYSKNDFSHLGSHQVSYGSLSVKNVTSSITETEVALNTEVELSTITAGASIEVSYFENEVYGEYVAYTGPIIITEDVKFKARGLREDLETSGETEFGYTIRVELPITDILVARTAVEDVKVKGIVTVVDYKGYAFIQDSTAGIGVKVTGADLNVGDEIEAFGTPSSDYGFEYLNIANAQEITVISSNNVLVAPVVALADLNDSHEAQLVTIENVVVSSDPNYGEFEVTGGNADFRLKPINQEWLTKGIEYDTYKGVLHYGYKKFILVATNEIDIDEDSTKVRAIKSTLTDDIVDKGATVELSTLTSGAAIYYTVNGNEPTSESTLYTGAITINATMTLKAIATKADLIDSIVFIHQFNVVEDAVTVTISEIQGETHVSTYDMQAVENVEGIVTAVLNYKFDMYGSALVGFYMQSENGDDNDATSDAIYVQSTTPVTVGDKVKINGIVRELVKEQDFYAYDQENNLAVTSITQATVAIVSNGNALPLNTILGQNGRQVPHDQVSSNNFSVYDVDVYAIDFYESLEGMLVTVENPLIVGPYVNRVITVVPDNGAVADTDGDKSIHGGIILSDTDSNTEKINLNGALKASMATVKYSQMGDQLSASVVGILEYEWGSYQIYLTEDTPVITNPKSTVDVLKFENSDEELTIGSFNVYNHGGDDKQSKTDGIASQIVDNMKSPDIIGLVEVQDNDGKTNSSVVSADEVYQAFIDAIILKGGPVYRYTDISPVEDQEGGESGGNIRVGFLYNPITVALKTDVEKGGSSEAVASDASGHLTLNPGRISPNAAAFDGTRKSLAAEFSFRGEDVIVIANHFKSKGGDNAVYGNVQQPVLHSAVKRIQQAQLVNDFVDSVLSNNPDANIVVVGDMNDFQFSNPLKALRGEGSEKVLTNMIDTLQKPEQFSYMYGGNAQILDHILVANALETDTKIDIININSILGKEDNKRYSDHDPVVVSIANIGEEGWVSPVIASKIGEVAADSTVKLMATNGATIYYAIDDELDLETLTNNEVYTDVLTIDVSKTINAVAVKNDVKGELTTLVYTVEGPPVVNTMAEARAMESGSNVIVEVVVTTEIGFDGNKSFMFQDETGGGYVYNRDDYEGLAIGKKIRITGKTSAYKGMFQLKPTTIEVLGDSPLPTPEVILANDTLEQYESELITIENVVIKAISSNNDGDLYITVDQDGTEIKAKIFVESGNTLEELNAAFSLEDAVVITGLFKEYETQYTLAVRSIEDINLIPEGPKLVDLGTFDLAFNPQNTFDRNNFVNVSVNIENDLAEEVSGTIIFKIEKDDKVYRIGMVQRAESNSGSYTVGFDTFGFKKGEYSVKAYYWKDLITMEALSDLVVTTFIVE